MYIFSLRNLELEFDLNKQLFSHNNISDEKSSLTHIGCASFLSSSEIPIIAHTNMGPISHLVKIRR